MKKKGFTLLETIISITIFSIFAVAIVLSFEMYIKISKMNNISAYERVEMVSNLEKFLAHKDIKKSDTKITLVNKNITKDFPQKIYCVQRKETADDGKETLKAFVLDNEKMLK